MPNQFCMWNALNKGGDTMTGDLVMGLNRIVLSDGSYGATIKGDPALGNRLLVRDMTDMGPGSVAADEAVIDYGVTITEGNLLLGSGADEVLIQRLAGTRPRLSIKGQVNSHRLPNLVNQSICTSYAWRSRASAANNDWRSICWSPELSLFAAVADSGTGTRVMTSPDGVTWTIRTSAADNDWQAICWSPELGLFVAVAASGTGNRVMTSPDGVTWTSRTSAADNEWRDVCWSAELSLLVAVAATGTGNRVMTSPDGATWTIGTTPADYGWSGICWSAELSLFVAVAASGTIDRVMTSPDGFTWTIGTTPTNNGWRRVCWSAELRLFAAVSNSGTGDRVMTSPDGVTWTSRTSAADNDWRGVCWSAELHLFVAVAITGTGNRVMTSPDGITWTIRTSAADNSWYGVCWSAELGMFAAVAITGTGNRVMTSPRLSPAKTKVGTYAGDGTDNRNIDIGINLLAMADVTVSVMDTNDCAMMVRPEVGQGDLTKKVDYITYADEIQTLTTTGFQVGTLAGVNSSGRTYWYVVTYQELN